MDRVGSIVDDVGTTGTAFVSCLLLPVTPKSAAVVAAPTAADAPATAASVNLDMLLTGGMRASRGRRDFMSSSTLELSSSCHPERVSDN